MCWGGEFTGEIFDGAEGMRGEGASWINGGEGGADGFIGDED